jgi:hypothetical protein
VDKVGLYARDNVVYHLALKRKSKLYVPVALGINCVAVIKAAVFRKMNSLVGKMAFVFPQFGSYELRSFDMEHPAVVRERHMNIGAERMKGLHKRGGNIGHAARLCRHLAGEIAHSLRKICNLRSDNKDSRIFSLTHFPSAVTGGKDTL